MSRRACLLAALLAAGAAAQAAGSPPAPPSARAAAEVRVPFGPPRVSGDAGMTRVVFDLPAGVTYTLVPTVGGLQVAVAGARVTASAAAPLGTNGMQYRADGQRVHLGTPFPLAPAQGWRAAEATVSSGARVLILDFGAVLVGGAGPSVRGQGLAGAAATPGAAPPWTPPPPPAPVEDGREANVLAGGGNLSDLTPTRAAPPPAPVLPAAAAGTARPSGLAGRTPGTPTRGAVVGAPRLGRNPGLTRLVLDLPPGVTYRIVPGAAALRVELSGVQATGPLTSSGGVSGEVRAWRSEVTPDGVALTVTTEKPTSERGGWRGLLLPPTAGSPQTRLVLDISPALADHTPLPAPQRALARVPPIPAPRSTALLALPATLVKPRVVIDPGHGGRDPGAVGSVTEKQVALDVSRRVRDLLSAAGVEVVLTRDTDRELHPDKGTDLRMRAAVAAGTQLFVSVHANATPPASVLRGYGIETWWNPNHPQSQALARSLQTAMVAQTSAFDRGIRGHQSLAVLRHNRVPAALVEIGFVSHPVDGLNLQSTHYLDRVALGIASGVTQALLGGVAASGSPAVGGAGR